MTNKSIWKYANPPFDIISKEFADNKEFQKQYNNSLIILFIILSIFLQIPFAVLLFIIAYIYLEQTKLKPDFINSILFKIDYAQLQYLEKKWKIVINTPLKNKIIEVEKMSKSYQNSFKTQSSWKDSQYNLSNKKESQAQTQDGEKQYNNINESKINQTSNTQKTSDIVWNQEKETSRYRSNRKSIFDDYVSVRDSFSNSKKR
jgi:hypothetical protein